MNENGILFYDETHKARYYKLLQDYTNGTADPYREQLAYLIALTPETYKHRSGLCAFHIRKGTQLRTAQTGHYCP